MLSTCGLFDYRVFIGTMICYVHVHYFDVVGFTFVKLKCEMFFALWFYHAKT